jgi:E3 ubiquitin-protein ligase UBR7
MNAEKSVFLKEDWKIRLDRCPSCAHYLNHTLNLAFLLSPSLPYEPPPQTLISPEEEVVATEEDSYHRSLSLLEKHVPRAALIESIKAINKMKIALNEFLKPFAEQKKLVTKQDILSFFDAFRRERN